MQTPNNTFSYAGVFYRTVLENITYLYIACMVYTSTVLLVIFSYSDQFVYSIVLNGKTQVS
jgi:hypothetical protein